MKPSNRFADGGRLAVGGWDALAEVLAAKIRRMRQALAVTGNRIDITTTRGDDDGTSVAVMAEWEVSVFTGGNDPTLETVTDWERWEAIKQALDTLPPKAAECVRRYVGFGCDQEDPVQIAESLGLNRSTVWANITRAKVKLAPLLQSFAPRGHDR